MAKMDKSAAEAYIYAKASGILGKSFVNHRASMLFTTGSLSALWTLLFNSPVPQIPEVLLAEKIEKESFKKFVKQYTDFIEQYSSPDQILLDQLAIYEAENLKAVGGALCSGEKKCPHLIDLGKFAKLNFKAYPDIKKITEKSYYSWYNTVPEIHEQQKLEFKIDMQFIRHLWDSIGKTSGETKVQLEKLYLDEYVIKNIVWALRLKINYNMENQEIIKNLIYVTDSPSHKDPIAAPALDVLNKDLENFSEWENWKYAELLNPKDIDGLWKVDPRWIEINNRRKIEREANLLFHQYPMSTVSLISWYKIKNFELSCIRTAVESLRMNIEPSEAMTCVGIKSE